MRRTVLRIVLTLLSTAACTAVCVPLMAMAMGVHLKPKPKGAIIDTLVGRAVFSAANVGPGQSGSGTVTIRNAGSEPAKMTVSQALQVQSGIEARLELSLNDDTTATCIYPKVLPPKPKPTKPPKKGGKKGKKAPKKPVKVTVKPLPCGTFMSPWIAGGGLRNTLLLGKKGVPKWKGKESHTFTLRWRFAASSPNSDQGRLSSFSLDWRGAG